MHFVLVRVNRARCPMRLVYLAESVAVAHTVL
jgi:hypothetical protein